MPPTPTPESGPHAGVMPERCVVVVLAAGAGSRFDGDGHKLSAKISERGDATVIERSLNSALAAGVGPVVVVTGAVDDIVPTHLNDAIVRHHNARWQDGQITSLHAGIDVARALGATDGRRRPRRPALHRSLRLAGRGSGGRSDRRRHLRRTSGQPREARRRSVGPAADHRRRRSSGTHARSSGTGS